MVKIIDAYDYILVMTLHHITLHILHYIKDDNVIMLENSPLLLKEESFHVVSYYVERAT